MGHDVSKFIDHDPSLRRNPHSAIENENRFQFCAKWNSKNVHDMLRVYSYRYVNDNAVTISTPSQRQEQLQLDIQRLENLLASLENQEAPPQTCCDIQPASENSGESSNSVVALRESVKVLDHAATKSSMQKQKMPPQAEELLQRAFLKSTEVEYVKQRHKFQLELETKQRDLRALYQMPSMDGINFTLPVTWSIFYHSVQEVDLQATYDAINRTKRLWHPTCEGYTMEKDPHAETQLREIRNKSSATVIQIANHEIDGHTDDNADVSDDDISDVNSDDEAEEGIEILKPPIEINEAGGVTLTLVTLNEHMSKMQFDSKPPLLFDASLRSPVFFGYSTTHSIDHVTASKEFEAGEENHEMKYYNARLTNNAQKFNEAVMLENGKLRALQERRDVQLEKREKDRKARERELDDARREGLDPTADFFRKAEESQCKLVAQMAAEDETFDSQKASILLRMTKATEASEKEISVVQNLRAPGKPVGAYRLKFHTEQLQLAHQTLAEAKSDLEQAVVTLDQTKNRTQAQMASNEVNNAARAQLLFAEDLVKAAEKRVAFVLTQIDEEEFMLKRVPLDHACYKNVMVHRTEIAKKAAVRLQTSWRAKKGRYDATLAARKQAFYHAKGLALMEARQRVETEWATQDAVKETSLDKMKFDAKIRMRQVKLRTKGLAFSREEVLDIMTEESVQDAMEEVDHRYREMEESAGYCPRVLRFNPLDMSHFSDIATSLVDQVQRARLPTQATARLLRAIAERELKEKKEVPETTIPSPEPIKSDTVSLSFVEAAQEKKKHVEGRQNSMMRGESPTMSLCSVKERRRWLDLVTSNPPKNEWCDRLFFVCDGMTELKLSELLMELPSKRHTVEYVKVFKNAIGGFEREALVMDLMEHFRIRRGVEDLADALINIASSDAETLWTDDILGLLSNQEFFLTKFIKANHQSKSSELAREIKRRGRDADAKLKLDLELQRNTTLDAKKKANEAITMWREAEFSLFQAERRLELRKDEVPVQLHDRVLWSERLKRALMATDSGEATYIEIVHVCQDFLEVARNIAIQIIREHGINVRHMGLLRAQFYFKLEGVVSLTFNSPRITTSSDMTREVARGDIVHIEGDTYMVSESLDDEYSANDKKFDSVFITYVIENPQASDGSKPTIPTRQCPELHQWIQCGV
ncbi:Aste57867_299 [Aphanomyces stellatus]|uniref:Aste57867_299 protein n=1 Tax=Aphanomyces stellatus TaxID=120398 RepID=A0A485K5C6_9STRA|nr:hypothetical protein As57867_000299 [Aphanomyces stellatus]VFT77525.1 Aste57867_299 [Aphanomyces stellatus]